ncbi:hypothetical protein CRV15_35495 (plasmid) [Streptomyces clavuligerus]|uniref:Uncharacterized protein n=1 Tax=Streptomyces clavuligerus TaxID=1901 RepID=B5GM00_STRCL|nr:hypothetical protein SSCG_00374 [Streptomyces clavuligerus]EFG05003.1 Hypothetical protein SCLAV_p1522 [Streptomyces clavuligerus]QCS10817.1 hypothetical protein CRV15_35495 [Streptomyces clavuligerus]QPJ97146.1 hypothetical protein GE265_28980 [Streptomyces clavuligerus]
MCFLFPGAGPRVPWFSHPDDAPGRLARERRGNTRTSGETLRSPRRRGTGAGYSALAALATLGELHVLAREGRPVLVPSLPTSCSTTV